MSTWTGQHVYVMGLGRFGGGVGVSRYLARQGARVTVGDSGDPSQLNASIRSLHDLIDSGAVSLALGEHDTEDLQGIDALVVNPAVPRPWANPFIQHARSNRIRTTTEIEIAYRLLDSSRVIAVTGSAGKSTTSAMIHHGLIELGHTSTLGGNIGGSLLGDCDQSGFVILELSSAMLHWLGESGVLQDSPPLAACVTNCLPNHLDWHGDESHYTQSKRLLARTVSPCGHLILGQQVQDWDLGAGTSSVRVIRDSDALVGCTVPGRHNGINAAMASSAIDAVLQSGTNTHQIHDAIRSFSGLPHRLQLVHEGQSVRFYNDSKCTVPGATQLAVDAISGLVDHSKIHLIAGGYDKGSDLSSVSDLAPSLAGLYAIGDTGRGLVDSGGDRALYCGDLENAMKAIASRLSEGDVVLLSPACASWDQFSNYEERGDRFTELAKVMHGERV